MRWTAITNLKLLINVFLKITEKCHWPQTGCISEVTCPCCNHWYNALSSQMAKCAFSSIFILTKYLFHVCVTAQYEYYFLLHSVMCFFSFFRSLYSNKSRVFNFLTTSYLKVWLLWYFVLTSGTLWQLIEMSEVKSGKTSQKCSDPFFLHLCSNN